jgi:OmpA family
MQYPIKMGWMDFPKGWGKFSLSDVGVNISGDVRLLPDGSTMMPWKMRHLYPGGQLKDFSFPLDAPLSLSVKAGASGALELRLFVDYYFFLRDQAPTPGLDTVRNYVKIPDWIDPAPTMPDPQSGSIHCYATWNYSSTRSGRLKLEYVTADLSPVSDGFSVRVDREKEQVFSSGGQIQLIPRFEYSGQYTAASVTLIHPTAFLNLIDIEQTKIPVPPVPGKALEHTVYFLFNKRDHLSAENNNPKNFINSEDQLKSLRIFMESIKNGVGLQNIQRVEVHGYASAPGTTEYNDILSSDRAQNIAAWLRTNYHNDIPQGAIWPHGERSDSSNEKDLPSERRVDVRITLKAAAKP